jgi:hypothetical protein
MKTTIYNLQKGIITAILVLVISSFGFATTKVHETTSVTNSNNSETLTVNNDAVSSATVEANKSDLSERIEDWMSDGSYWETDNSAVTTEKDLAFEIESWMANGSYWKSDRNDQNSGKRITHKIKSWMTNGSFWAPDGE